MAHFIIQAYNAAMNYVQIQAYNAYHAFAHFIIQAYNAALNYVQIQAYNAYCLCVFYRKCIMPIPFCILSQIFCGRPILLHHAHGRDLHEICAMKSIATNITIFHTHGIKTSATTSFGAAQ